MAPQQSFPLARLSNEALLAEVKRLAGCERVATAQLIAHLAELDARRRYLGAGFPSLFVYCTTALRLCEGEAYNRIVAARVARRFPVVLDGLQDGSINLTTIRFLAPHLTAENHEELLAAAAGRSRREVEELLARRFPRPLVPPSVRKLPATKPKAAPLALEPDPVAAVEPSAASSDVGSDGPLPAAPATPVPNALLPQSRRAVVAPLTPELYKITFTANAETHRKLRLAQDLLRRQIPDGNPAEIFDRALSVLLEDLAKKKLGATRRARPGRHTAPGSRHVPDSVKRAVWLRDGGRCAFVAKSGRRCGERGFLEFHHVKPYASGGEASVGNIALRCRSHNGHEAELYFGRRGPGRREGIVSEPQGGYGRTRGAEPATRSGTSSCAPCLLQAAVIVSSDVCVDQEPPC